MVDRLVYRPYYYNFNSKSMPSRAKNPVHKLQKSKYTYTIALPIEFVRELGWIENQKVVIKKVGNKLVVEDWDRKVKNRK